eukprot:Skav220857  [mRNA]  locus=scaffold1888:616743:631004:- [translate_table: standard]
MPEESSRTMGHGVTEHVFENWGIITLTDRALIDETASLRKRQGASLVAHEVSHMWFGDLVTPSWWDDLWLKEGFASWVNLLPLDVRSQKFPWSEAKYPEWRVWDSWILSKLYGGSSRGGALEVDQYTATHPIEVSVNHPSEVQEIFDDLSYNKGSAVVNMLYHSLGHETFRKGLSDWLEKCKEKRMKVNHWTIPVSFQHDGSQSHERLLFSGGRTRIPRQGEWIKLNAGIRTPLRVCYSKDLLQKIVKSGFLPVCTALKPMDRVGLVNDTFALVRAGLELPSSAVRGVALRLGLSNKASLWAAMSKRLAAAANTEERDQLLIALMGHGDGPVLEDWVAKAIEEWETLFAGLAANRHHKRLAWRMLTRHWDAVYKVWGQSQFKMKAIIGHAMSKADPDEVEAFFQSHPCDVAKRSIQQGLEGLAADAQLNAKAKDLHNYFQSVRPWEWADCS